MPQPKLVYLQLTGIKRIPTFGGATYTVADGVTRMEHVFTEE